MGCILSKREIDYVALYAPNQLYDDFTDDEVYTFTRIRSESSIQRKIHI